jgi:hypothetical protein
LLIQLDQSGGDAIGPGAVEVARKLALDPLLRREYWDELAAVPAADRKRCRLIMAAVVAAQFGNRLNAADPPLPDSERPFDAEAVVGFLQRHASAAVPEKWSPTPGEIGRLLRALTAGGAVAPVPGQAGAFHFPGALVPDLLVRLHRRADSGFDLYVAIDTLAAQVESG